MAGIRKRPLYVFRRCERFFSSLSSVRSISLQADSTTTQNLVYTSSSTNPGSSAVDAQLIMHDNIGQGSLNVTIPGSQSSGEPNSGEPSTSRPLLKFQKMIIAHGILCLLGFLLFLPAGSLWARWTRSLSPGFRWLPGHWVIQFGISKCVLIMAEPVGS